MLPLFREVASKGPSVRKGTAALGKMPQDLSMGNSDVHTDLDLVFV